MSDQTDALSIFQSNGTDADKLRVAYDSIIDQVQKSSLSIQIKNMNLSGNPLAGSVIVRRLESAGVQDYGTARAAGAGNKIKNNGVTINLDQRKEIVEEVNKFDLEQYGLAGMVARRAQNFGLKLASFLDYAFFTQAVSDGTAVDVTAGADIAERVELLIQSIETTKNDNVDGVDRDMIVVTLTPSAYADLATYIDKLPNPTNGGVQIPTFHKVKIFSNTRQDPEAIAMVMGAVAQPVAVIDFAANDIPLSADTALQLFFNYGVKAVMPDLINYSNTVEVSA